MRIDTFIFQAKILLLPTILGGREGGVNSGYRPNLRLNDKYLTCCVLRLDNVKTKDIILPGDICDVEIELPFSKEIEQNYKMNLEDCFKTGTQIQLYEYPKMVAVGVVE